MASNTEKIGLEALALVDQLVEAYGEDVKIHTVAIVVDATAERDGVTINPVVSRCSDPRPWVQAALLAEACTRAGERNEEAIEAAHPRDEE